MKVNTSHPIRTATGHLLAPEDLNQIFLYGKDCLDDVVTKRFCETLLPIHFVQDVGTPYTNAMGAEQLRFRFTCPVTCTVLRGELSANMTATADVQVNITDTGGSTPSGCTTPWLSTPTAGVASAATVTSDLNNDSFELTAGTEYRISVSSTAAFSLERFDVILHVRTDRWTLAGAESVPTFSPVLFTDASAPNATLVSANETSLAAQAALLSANTYAPSPMFFTKAGILSATDADICKFVIPRFLSTRAASVIRRVYLYAVMNAAGGAGDTITAIVRNAAGDPQVTVTADVNGVSFRSADSGNLAIALSTTGVSAATTTDDFTIEFANNDAANNCLKAYALVWVSRV